MSRLPALLAALVILVGLGGCSSDPVATITPLPRAGSLKLDRATKLVEPPMKSLAEKLGTVPGTEKFELTAEGQAEKPEGTCVYRSALYLARSDTTQAQWEKLAAAARPIVEGMGFDTESWVDQHAAVGGGLVARTTSGAVFYAQPRSSDDAEAGAFDTVRFYVVVPLDETEC